MQVRADPAVLAASRQQPHDGWTRKSYATVKISGGRARLGRGKSHLRSLDLLWINECKSCSREAHVKCGWKHNCWFFRYFSFATAQEGRNCVVSQQAAGARCRHAALYSTLQPLSHFQAMSPRKTRRQACKNSEIIVYLTVPCTLCPHILKNILGGAEPILSQDWMFCQSVIQTLLNRTLPHTDSQRSFSP